jgi:hypothetical protein
MKYYTKGIDYYYIQTKTDFIKTFKLMGYYLPPKKDITMKFIN